MINAECNASSHEGARSTFQLPRADLDLYVLSSPVSVCCVCRECSQSCTCHLGCNHGHGAFAEPRGASRSAQTLRYDCMD